MSMSSASANQLPSQVTNTPWIWVEAPYETDKQPTLGKWLVFEKLEHVDNTWSEIAAAVRNGSVRANGAKVATMMDTGYNDGRKVICVYTSEQRVDEVGRLLLELLPCVRKHETIRYKTDQATISGIAGIYSSNRAQHNQKPTCRQATWNNGDIVFKN